MFWRKTFLNFSLFPNHICYEGQILIMRFHQPQQLKNHFSGVSEKWNLASLWVLDTNMCVRFQMFSPTNFQLHWQAFGESFLVLKGILLTTETVVKRLMVMTFCYLYQHHTLKPKHALPEIIFLYQVDSATYTLQT